MDEEFNPGDVVRLKAGGAKMTVERTEPVSDGSRLVHVVWFDEQNNLRRDRVPAIMLAKVPAGVTGSL